MNFRHPLICLCLLGMGMTASAQLKLARVFGEHMVLQRKADVPVWGWANPGEKVSVSMQGQQVKTKANAEGKWKVTLAPLEAGGPFEFTVSAGSKRIQFSDVLVGEVWVCSGQSNMEWIVRNSNDAQEEISRADYPLIRHMKVKHRISAEPLEDLGDETQWEACSPETAGDFSAVGFFYARELFRQLYVPIGLINTSWGGTEVEAWASAEALDHTGYFDDELSALADTDLLAEEARQVQALQARFGNLRGGTGMEERDLVWAKEMPQPDQWQSMELPGLWEEKGLKNVDGIIWFKKEVDVPSNLAGKPATLSLGPIDDNDVTWVNGKQVGATNQYDIHRSYSLLAGTLTPGRNVITIRVEDTGGGGGIWGKSEQMHLEIRGEKIPLTGEWRYRPSQVTVNATLHPNEYASTLFNGMLNPLIPYAMQGVIWYQGESNANRAYQYRDLFPLMIEDWRTHWGIGYFPFYFVQLANFQQPQDQPGESTWAELREAQTMTLRLPNTGMASAIDIGEADDIHPRNKQEVGRRLALQALRQVYGRAEILSDGPMQQTMRVRGNQVFLEFENVGEGLEVKNKYGYVNGFALAGADQQFHWAKAKVLNDSVVVVQCNKVLQPVAVRYGWANNPDDLNLYNSEGLPANPFRTDEWPGITEEKKEIIED